MYIGYANGYVIANACYSLVQLLWPSPVNPVLHSHKYSPWLTEQVAFSAHLFTNCESHSGRSTNITNSKYTKWQDNIVLTDRLPYL